jgi:hypothetical protein
VEAGVWLVDDEGAFGIDEVCEGVPCLFPHLVLSLESLQLHGVQIQSCCFPLIQLGEGGLRELLVSGRFRGFAVPLLGLGGLLLLRRRLLPGLLLLLLLLLLLRTVIGGGEFLPWVFSPLLYSAALFSNFSF